MVDIGRKIRQARKSARLSQPALARELDVVRDTIAKYESGKRAVPVDNLARIATVTGRSVSWFFDEKPEVAGFEDSVGQDETIDEEAKELLLAAYRYAQRVKLAGADGNAQKKQARDHRPGSWQKHQGKQASPPAPEAGGKKDANNEGESGHGTGDAGSHPQEG
ncbi:MAG: helix-turn-helix domain-containing protein [Vulcanimicrobiota bacterium]